MTVGERITMVRKELKWTRKKMCEVLGVPNRTYQNYEYGVREPDLPFIHLFADKTGYSEKWIATGEGLPFDAEEGTREQVVGKIVARVMSEDDPMFMRFVKALSNLNAEDLKVLYKIALSLVEESDDVL